jgi:branched-chain amino acid transport system substrate-binding protein
VGTIQGVIASRSGLVRRVGVALAAVVAAAAVGGACSTDGDSETGSTTTVSPTTTTLPARLSDGVLRIGVLMPRTGTAAAIGEAVRTSVRAAVEVVNASGGVMERPVEVVERDEGLDTASSLAAVNTLLSEDRVDVIIGPASSRVALGVLGQIVNQGVLACSPVASAIALSSFPDQSLFIRTMPSDALQAEAIARLVDQTGRNRVGVLHPDDVFGRNFADAAVRALRTLGMELTNRVSYPPDADDLSGPALSVLADDPSAVVVLGNADVGVRMLVAAVDAAPTPSPWFIVNDALRRPDQPTLIADLDDERRSRIRGVSPAVLPANADLLALLQAPERAPSTAFTAMAFDCVNLIALAARAGDTDDPKVIAAQAILVSRGGTTCRDFPACAELLAEGRNVDYNGPEGVLRLDGNGEVTLGAYERFSFDDTGRDVTDLRFTVGNAG